MVMGPAADAAELPVRALHADVLEPLVELAAPPERPEGPDDLDTNVPIA